MKIICLILFANLCAGENRVKYLICSIFLIWYTSWSEKFINNYYHISQVFATPETLIGFHPDAGASFFLSHLPGHLGMLSAHYCFLCVVHLFYWNSCTWFVDLELFMKVFLQFYFWFTHKSMIKTDILPLCEFTSIFYDFPVRGTLEEI